MIGAFLTAAALAGSVGQIMPSAPPASPEALAWRANEEYQAGLAQRADGARAKPHFHNAAMDYEKLALIEKHASPELRRNEAQAWLLSGDLARAIRAYVLGLRLAPHDDELRSGLAYAREQIAYPPESGLAEMCQRHEPASLFQFIPYRACLYVAAGLYAACCFAFARAWITNRRFWWWSGGLLLLAMAFLTTATMLEMGYALQARQRPMVVVAHNGTPLRRGNGEHYPLRSNAPLPAGVEMQRLGERGGWSQVQLAGGAVGWVKSDALIKLE